MADGSNDITDILDDLAEMSRKGDEVSVGATVDAMGGRGHGPLLFVPALIELSPIGGIPGVPSLLALIIGLIAGQIVWGHEAVWLPDFLRRRSISAKRMGGAAEKLRPPARWLERWFGHRLPRLAGPRAVRVAAAVCLLLVLAVPPLEIVPFASSGPMAAIAMFGLAFTLRDGLLMALGFAMAAGAAALAFGLVGG
jgi:hypothetical protein